MGFSFHSPLAPPTNYRLRLLIFRFLAILLYSYMGLAADNKFASIGNQTEVGTTENCKECSGGNSVLDLDIQYPNLTGSFIDRIFRVSKMASENANNTNSSAIFKEPCGENQLFDSLEQMCCTKCPRGEGVVIPCLNDRKSNEKTDTECETCSKYRDENDDSRILKYSAVEDTMSPCMHCGRCPKNAHEVHRCNGTHNTKCRCDSGFYSSSEVDYSKPVCVECKTCPEGTFVAKSCSHASDTLCAECPKGTFSDVQNANQCKQCTLCPLGDQMTRNCSKSEDRVCAGNTNSLSGIRTNSGSEDFHELQNQSVTSGPNVILGPPVYCAILGAIIVSLIVYVILKRWKLCPSDRKRSKKPPPTGVKNSASLSNNNNNGGLLPLFSAGPLTVTMECQKGPHQNMIPLNYQQPTKYTALFAVNGKSPKKSQSSSQSNSAVAESQKLRYKDTVSIRQEAAAMGVKPLRRLLQKWNEDKSSDTSSFKLALAKVGHSELTFLVDQDLAISHCDSTGQGLILV